MNRKAFNFYKSYYDIVRELPDEDKLSFLMALLEMQFTGKEPENLSGMAKFAFISQKHSIVKQIEGYSNGLKATPPRAPRQAPPRGPHRDPHRQEKGEVQEQEQVQYAETFGTPSPIFFTVQAKYVSEKPCRIYPDGFKAYCNKHLLGFWFRKEYMSEIFFKENNGKMFKEHTHVNNVMLKINNG